MLRAGHRGGRRARRTAGARARLAGRGPVGRPQLGAVVGARRRAGDRPRRPAGASSYDDATGIVTASPAVKGGAELAPYLAERGPVLPRRALPHRRHRRLPAPGRPGLERPRLGLGRGVRRRGRRRDRGRRAGARRRRAEQRPLLGGPRRRARASSGVVTRFHLRTMPAPGHVAQTVHAYALDDFDEVMTWLHETHRLRRRHRRDRRADQDRPDAGARRRSCWCTGRRAGRRRGRGRRGAGAVPHLPRARPRAAGARRRPDHARGAARAAARTTTPRATAGRSTTPGSPGPRRRGRAGDATGLHHAAQRRRRSRSGSAWRRCGRCRTWRSRCSRRSTWRRTSLWEDPADDARVPGLARRGDGRPGAGHRRASTSATATCPVGRCEFMSDEAWARLQ